MKAVFKFPILFLTPIMVFSCTVENGTDSKDKAILESIELSGYQKTSFYNTDEFDYTGLIVTAKYSNSVSKEVTDYTVSDPDMSILGKQDVVVTYQDKTASYEITVSEFPELVSIELIGQYQTMFEQGEEFNTVGLAIIANYEDGLSRVVDYTSITEPDMNQLGEQEIVVTYQTVSTSYTITIVEPDPEEEEEFEGYMYLAMYRLDIALNDNTRHHLLPGIRDKDGNEVDVSELPLSNPNIITVSRSGGINSKKASTGTCVVTCIYTENESISAKCTVNVVEQLPVKEKGYKLLEDYSSLKQGDILVFAAPEYGLTASLDTLHSKLNVVESTFSSDKSAITSLGVGTAEFYLGIEEKDDEEYMTLEAQTGEYLVSTHQGKVKLDSSTKTNRFWDIHSNVDPETGEGNISDGAVIENYVTSLGYFMYNVSLTYFTTYVENSLRPGVMELPFLYRLEELD